MLDKTISRLDFSKPARQLSKLICGTNPWPVANTLYEGKLLKVYACLLYTSPAPSSSLTATMSSCRPSSPRPWPTAWAMRKTRMRMSNKGRLFVLSGPSGTGKSTVVPVSYTHLDVYKRQFPPFATSRTSMPLAPAVCALLRSRAPALLLLPVCIPWPMAWKCSPTPPRSLPPVRALWS